MALSNIKVYDEEIAGNTIELLGQQIEKFNQASGNAIILSSNAWAGDYSKESFYNQIASARRRVNRYGANGDVTATNLTQGEMVAVKIAGGFGPILFEPAQLDWMQRNPGEATMVIAEGFANALLADQLNTAIMAAVAAVQNQSALVNDVSGSGAITYNAINASHAKFGDRSGAIVTDVMASSVYHKLIDQNVTNSSRLFTAGDVRVVDIFGKIVVVSDIPALYEAGTPNKDKVLSVVNQGIIVDDASKILTNLETTNGKDRIETTWQADYSFGLRLKGYSWDTANGGKSPSDAEIATGANWDKAMAENKNTLGTLCVGSADA